MTGRRGLALIVVIGILGVLAALAAAFVMMAQLERRASAQRVNAARAYLLARSGIEDALARLELGQDPAYGGENWDGSGDGLLTDFEAAQETYRRTGAGTPADIDACPARHAMRPSFFVKLSGGTPDPALGEADGRKRGYSGMLAGDHAAKGNVYALKVRPLNAGIHINGGALDDLDRDPDGPGVAAAGFPLNPNAAAEVAPLLPNHVPDHRDFSMEGPNGFLVRLLNNLDAVVTDGATSDLGALIVGARPIGGYKSLDELPGRAGLFKAHLTLHAWTDPQVVKPQPMDGRPRRWEDIDDAHRIGAEAGEISGVRVMPLVPDQTITLNPGILGNGREPDLPSGGLPWTRTITAVNLQEGARTYPVTWERNYVYAWGQLRPSPPAMEPRAPLALNGASEEALASAFLGLQGVTLEVWDGSAGWDSGFGFYGGTAAYPYPSPSTEETPWIRTRVDYGMTYGTGARPWYRPEDYDAHRPPRSNPSGASQLADEVARQMGIPLPDDTPVATSDLYVGGKPLVQAAPLGRLKETPAITLGQALGVARQARQALGELGPARTWARVDAFVSRLPRWEDLNEDGLLDGPPYPVAGSGGAYLRKCYAREDADSDFIMQRETFTPQPGASWKEGIAWLDPHLPKAALVSFKLVPGLTFAQKDVLRAMANSNTDLNDFNPDANLWKEVDKTDVAGIAGDAYVHTTELSLDEAAGPAGAYAVGRVLDRRGRLLAQREAGASWRSSGILRDTTQADFMRGFAPDRPAGAFFSGPDSPYPLAGGQTLVSYPEPQTASGGPAANARYDGQISLGFVGTREEGGDRLRGDLFDTRDAIGAPAEPDLKGPTQALLLQPAGAGFGSVFPDGVYSEKDRTLKFPGVAPGQVSFWVKPNWFPEASPRAHALFSVSDGPSFGMSIKGAAPLCDIYVRPMGLYFVPARNNTWEDEPGIYTHSPATALGGGWPRRALLLGTTHSLFASEALNRRGILEVPPGTRPVGRLEAHRWQHVAHDQAAGLFLGGRPSGGGLSAGGGHYLGLFFDGSRCTIRLGEVAAQHNMNYVADATFAGLKVGAAPSSAAGVVGRYYKEGGYLDGGAVFISSLLPPGIRPFRATWTEIPCDLWFDEDSDGWLGDPDLGAGAGVEVPDDPVVGQVNGLLLYSGAGGVHGGIERRKDISGAFTPQNDRNGNGLRDVRIDLEIWDDTGRIARFDDPAAANRIPRPTGRLYYKAVFVNEWDPATRANYPLDVTPFLDDVTMSYHTAFGPKILSWEASGAD